MAGRHPSGGAAANTKKIDHNLRQATSAARSLAFATAGVSGQLNGMVGASAAVAENIAKASRNARIAASATGIGAVVAILGTIAAFTVDWGKETKEVANRLREVANETARIEAQAKGNRRLERELEIQAAMEGELQAAQKMEHFYRKFPELQEAIRRKASAAREALDAERRRAFGDALFELDNGTKPIMTGGSPSSREYQSRQDDLRRQAARRERDLERQAKEQGFNADQVAQLKERIAGEFESGMAELRYDMDAPARQLGDQLGRSIVGGISDGINTALRGGLGEGFKALTGGILVGFGEMMQEIGTQSLLAAQLLKAVVDAFRRFAPEGAIVASLALVAGGAILKGIGSSMAGAGGGGGTQSTSSSGRGALMGTVVAVGNGPVAAAGGAAAFSAPRPGNNYWIIGIDDPAAQRAIATMNDRGNTRRGS